jgi:hypothetical protein
LNSLPCRPSATVYVFALFVAGLKRATPRSPLIQSWPEASTAMPLTDVPGNPLPSVKMLELVGAAIESIEAVRGADPHDAGRGLHDGLHGGAAHAILADVVGPLLPVVGSY